MNDVKEKLSDNSDNNTCVSDNNENTHKVLTDEVPPVSYSQNSAESDDRLTETVANDVSSLAASVAVAVMSDSVVSAETSVALTETTVVSTESDSVLQSVAEINSSLLSTVAVNGPSVPCESSSKVQSQILPDSQLLQPYPVEVSFRLLS